MLPFLLCPPSLLQAPPEAPARAPEPAWWKDRGCPRLHRLGDQRYTVEGVNYLEESFFVDARALHRLLGPAPTPAALHRALLKGRVWMGCQLRMRVAVGASKRRALLTKFLKLNWKGATFDARRPDIQAFLDFNGRILNEEEEISYLFGPGDRLYVRYTGGDSRMFQGAELVGAFRRLEFGDDPENPGEVWGMVTALAARLDQLQP